MIFGLRRRPEAAPGEAAPARDEMDTIRDFWAWWERTAATLAEAIEAGRMARFAPELSAWVSAIDPGLEWELAPGRAAAHALVVSPGGSPELRATAGRWLKLAPAADATWEFHASRLADPDPARVGLEVDGRRYDPAQLRLRLNVDKDRRVIDVSVHHTGFGGLTAPSMKTVAVLMLDSLLGEDGVERWVGQVTFSSAVPKDAVAPSALTEAVAELAALPPPEWVVLESRKASGWPVLAMARQPLKRLDWPMFDLHGALVAQIPDASPDGLPGRPEALERLRLFEDELEPLLGADGVLVAHETSRGKRIFHLYCDRYGPLPERVEAWLDGRDDDAKVRWTPDGGWAAVERFR
jgi:hypothetical protein